MAESTLSLTVKDLEAEIGFFLGAGRGAYFGDPAWSTSQQAEITSVRNSGLRAFYFPEPLPNEKTSYDWSFLKPTATLVLPQGEQTVTLPDDFGGLEGQITLSLPLGQWYPINLTNEGILRTRYTTFPAATGRPELAALQPIKGTGPTTGQRQQLFVFPTADQAYTLQFPYYVLPDALSGAFPYPLGGAAHGETILESCLTIAEQRFDDTPRQLQVHYPIFLQRLAASIGADRKLKPQTSGYNGDRSDQRDDRYRRRNWNPVLVNGILY